MSFRRDTCSSRLKKQEPRRSKPHRDNALAATNLMVATLLEHDREDAPAAVSLPTQTHALGVGGAGTASVAPRRYAHVAAANGRDLAPGLYPPRIVTRRPWSAPSRRLPYAAMLVRDAGGEGFAVRNL